MVEMRKRCGKLRVEGGIKRMEQEKLEELRKQGTEADLVKTVEEIDDKVIFKCYTNQQILGIVNEIIQIDLLSVKYETREEILYFLCDVAAYYGFLDGVKWENIINVKEELEDDLKEYIAEIIELR